jgi:urocanate hydratase
VKPQYEDNIKWIKKAQENKLVVGSQARILYSDQNGRVAIALAFNEAIADKRIKVSEGKERRKDIQQGNPILIHTN